MDARRSQQLSVRSDRLRYGSSGVTEELLLLLVGERERTNELGQSLDAQGSAGRRSH
jgi:hypothetical protein